MDEPVPDLERHARALFAGAAAAIAAGLLVAGTASRTLGGVLTVLGWAACLWALHKLGRAGAGR